MEFEEFRNFAQLAAELFEARHFDKALIIYKQLLDSDISDRDKAMVCLNIAIVYEQLNEPDQTILWFDKGIRYEQPHCQFYVAESKAAYLASIGLTAESLAIYQHLHKQRYLQEADKERIRQCINDLLLDDPN